jgi:hypothetical protein
MKWVCGIGAVNRCAPHLVATLCDPRIHLKFPVFPDDPAINPASTIGVLLSVLMGTRYTHDQIGLRRDFVRPDVLTVTRFTACIIPPPPPPRALQVITSRPADLCIIDAVIDRPLSATHLDKAEDPHTGVASGCS